MYSQRGPAYSNMISVDVSVPLQWDQKNRQDRELAAKLALLEQRKAEHEDMLRAHVAEVRAMIDEWENGRERHRAYEREVSAAREGTHAGDARRLSRRRKRASPMCWRRAGTKSTCACKRCSSKWTRARLWAQLNFLMPDDAWRYSPAREPMPRTTQ